MSDFNLFDLIGALYHKKVNTSLVSQELLPVLVKWLSWDSVNISYLKSLIPFLFYIDAQHFYYLLFFTLPKRERIPRLQKLDKKKEEESELVKKLQYVLDWSNAELKANYKILNQVILNNKDYWEEELGC